LPADGLTIGFPRAVESHQGLFSDGNLFGAVKEQFGTRDAACGREQQLK
jgi:hypothetical protein